MTAETYLLRIQDLAVRIRQRKEQAKELRSVISSVSGIRYDSIRVQSSASADGIPNKIIQLQTLEEKIEADIVHLQYLKNTAIELIFNLSNPVYKRILIMRYVDVDVFGHMNSFYDIAEEINYSYSHTKRLHQEALDEFDKILHDEPQ